MVNEGPRMMDKILRGVDAATDGSGIVSITEGNWDVLGVKSLVQRSYFDLSGYNKTDLTTFFQGIDFQYAAPPTANDSRIQIFDFITTEYLSGAELNAVVGGTIKSGPGFPISTLNMEQIIYARNRTYSWPGIPDPASVSIPLHGIDLWGTCNAATADKLHITRVLVFGSASKVAMVPDVNVVITALIAKEKELPFLMRQKRSYELATGP